MTVGSRAVTLRGLHPGFSCYFFVHWHRRNLLLLLAEAKLTRGVAIISVVLVVVCEDDFDGAPLVATTSIVLDGINLILVELEAATVARRAQHIV